LAEESQQFLNFCQGNGFEAVATFLDVSANGASSGFRQMVEFIRHQIESGFGFLIVVVPDTSSLGDGPTEIARRYFQLSTLGVSVLSIDSGHDISGVLLDIWSAHRTNGSLSDKVKTAMRQMAVKGEALGRPPYGYRVGPRKRLVAVADEGSIVRYIFRLYLKDGLGIRRIARKLNEESHRTRKGGEWSMVTVRDILRNRAYVGTYSRFGVRVPASHAPLISQEDFQQVQERLDERRPTSEGRNVSPFLLSGLAYCAYCNNKMIGVTRRQRWRRKSDGMLHNAQYRYYQCGSRTNRSICDYHTHRAEELEGDVHRAIRDLKKGSSVRASHNGSSLQHAEEEIRRLRTKARRLDRRLEQYLDAAAGGSMDREKLHSLGLALANEHSQVEDTLVATTREAEQFSSEGERRRQQDDLLRRLRDGWDSCTLEEKQDLLKEAIARIVVTDEGVDLVLRS
jgi:site-specific DNA recombinase